MRVDRVHSHGWTMHTLPVNCSLTRVNHSLAIAWRADNSTYRLKVSSCERNWTD